jgi:thioredoxin 1
LKTKQWIQKDEFEDQVLKSPMPQLVLFAADWCGYCRRFLGVISEYKESVNGPAEADHSINVVNIDSGDGSLWETYNVDLVPTLIVFSSGKQIFRRDAQPMVGLRQPDLEDALKAAVVASSSSSS